LNPDTPAAAGQQPPGALTLLLPGDWHTPTGGYRYDRRMAQGLAAAGWALDLQRVDGPWPLPDAPTQARAAAALAGLPPGRLVLADGLAFGALPQWVAAHAGRLRWVALVHHPLHLETGLAPALRRQLLESETQALRHARRVVATSPRTARDLAEMGVPAERLFVVEPGVDAPNPSLPPAAPAGGPPLAPRPVQLLCVATVTPRKAHALLLQALAGLPALSWQLHCVGSLTRDPATAAQAQALAQALGLAERVHWHGELPDAAVQAHYAAADLLVLPSLHEGYGMVVAEALAAGLPVLCSDAGALPQTLPAQAGLCVPAGQPAAWQQALHALISQPAQRQALAMGARAAGRRLPSWPTQAAHLAAVLAAVLAEVA
jgi:glycosyltransferase involved in cell wall biosynthesis